MPKISSTRLRTSIRWTTDSIKSSCRQQLIPAYRQFNSHHSFAIIVGLLTVLLHETYFSSAFPPDGMMTMDLRFRMVTNLNFLPSIMSRIPNRQFESGAKTTSNRWFLLSTHRSLALTNVSKQQGIRLSSSLWSSPTANWERITNHQTSKTVKLFKSIHRANKSKRAETNLTVAEGVRLVTDILSHEESRRLVRRIVVSESLFCGDGEYQKELEQWLRLADEESKQRKVEFSTNPGDDSQYRDPLQSCIINIGTDQVLAACSGTVSTQGVVALIEIPPQYDHLQSASAPNKSNSYDDEIIPPFYLILDGLSDPGNVGTLLRTCAASHVTALILLPDSCDVWNPKAVRSAMGASFRVPVLEIGSPKDQKTEEAAFDKLLKLMGHCGVDNDRIFAATMDDSGNETTASRKSIPYFNVDWLRHSDKRKVGASALILGKEGEGLRLPVRRALKQGKISTVHVPMAPGTESLNAAVCGSVIMFERMRQWLCNNENKAEIY
mmetsp:Transcript_30908/g.61357  ORF Transcript_30908/g.61357 Transcript_30908/m.61357 type:complete len:495 (-) Transcript_30908:434-1918(-)